jgi:hypothetical protein
VGVVVMGVPFNLGSATSSTTGVTSINVTTSAAANVGDVVAVGLGLQYTTAPTDVTVSDSAGNTYTVSLLGDTELMAVGYAALTVALPLGSTITVAWTGTTDATGADVITDCLPGGGTLDGTVGTVTNVSTAVHTLTVSETAGDTVWGVDVSAPSNSGAVTSSPFTQLGQVGARRPMVTAYHQPGSTSSVSFTNTWANSHSGSMIALAFTPAAPSTNPTATDTGTTSAVSMVQKPVTGSDTATLDDTPDDILISDATVEVNFSESSSLGNLAVNRTDALTLTESSDVAATPAASDSATVADGSAVTILGSNPTTTDLFTFTDVGLLGVSELISGIDLFTFDDLSFLVEAGGVHDGIGSVTIVTRRGVVTFNQEV